ncbi:hypothetical protein GE09DRAFT_1260006 [Coniochaeta sp. 2T2.1]|nr:hypothetical protein GE09DRAFT_1260006 [Coniochaeta sp. 2T2.1]
MLWPRALLLLVSSTLAGPVERRQADRDFGPVQVTDADDPSMVTDVDDSSELPSNDGISTDFDNIESSQTIESPETITTPILTTGAPASVSITVTTAEDPEETDRPEETEEQDTAEEEDTTQIPPTVSDASPLISGFLTVQTPQPTDVEDVTSTVTVTWTQVAGRVETKAVSVTSVTTVTFTSTTLITSTITSGELDASTTTRYFTVTVPAIVHSGPALEPSTKRPDPNRRTAYIPGSAMVRLAKRATIFRTVTEILTETSVSTTTATRMVARRTSTIIVAKIAVTSIIQAVARATVTVDSTLTVTFPSVTRGVPISTTTVTLPTMVTSSTTENASDKSTETPLPAAGGLSNAGKGGIGGGVSVIGILAVAIGVSMWRKRRQKKAIPVAENPPEMAHGQPPNQSNNPFSDFGGITAHHAQELPAPQVPVAPVEVAATEEITQGKTQTLAPQNAEASGSSSVPELESRNAITEPATLSAPLKNDPGPSSTAPANGFVFTGVNSALDLTDSFPRNEKFLYQDSPFNTLPTRKLVRTTSASLQRSLATKYLSLIAQRDAFIAGPASSAAVICFPVDSSDPGHSRREAEATISVLDPTQKPELVFCPGPGDIPPLSELNVDRIACKVVLDGLEGLPLTVPLETTWYLNSKAALADSKLPTPRMEVIEVSGFCKDAGACCEVCIKNGAGTHFVPADCSGARGNWIKEEEKRIVDAVRRKPVPFVLKNQQTFGGAGTWVVHSEENKADLLDVLSGPDGVLRKMLARVTEENHHLKPATIIVSEIVKDPIGDYGITFFVTKDGDAIFLGASEQMTDGNNAWIGSTIDYTHQDSLQDKFDPLVKRTTAWLAEKGYYGPAGMDILETATPGQTDGHTGEDTAYHIVDLNARTSGSMCLPVMRGHFTRLGLKCASSFGITVNGTREDFIETWRDEFTSGRMCILSWYHDGKTNKSIADVVIGAADEADLQERMKKVRDTTEEVVF